MTQVNGSLLGLTSSSRKCGLGIWNPETLRAGCDLTQPWAACHRGSFSCSLCRDNLQHLSTLKHVDAPQAIIQQYWLGEHCRFGFTANVVWSQSYFNDSTVYSLCPFETQFSTSFPSFSLDVSRAALFSACESVVATFFWKHVNVLTTHLFRDFLDYCLFFFVAASQNTTTQKKYWILTRIMTCCLSQAWCVCDIANLCPPRVCSCWKVAASSRKTLRLLLQHKLIWLHVPFPDLIAPSLQPSSGAFRLFLVLLQTSLA